MHAPGIDGLFDGGHLMNDEPRLQAALEVAYRQLGRRDRTVAELRWYLRRRELDPAAIESAPSACSSAAATSSSSPTTRCAHSSASRARRRSPPTSGPRFAPHPPQRRRTLAETELLGDREAVALVEAAITRRGGLEVGGHALGVATVEDRPQQRGADPAPLPVRDHADERQVVVRLLRML